MTATVDTFEEVWVVCVMLCLCALGVGLNALVILVVTLTPTMRRSTDLFIVNLSVSSILLGGLSLPLKIASTFYNQIDLYASDLACKITQFVPLLTIMSAISTMTAISFERYFVIARQKNFTLRTTLVIILIIWGVSVATSAPQLYEYSSRLVPNEDGNGTHLSCGSHDILESFETVYASVILAVSYLIPLMLISMNYFRLVAFLHRLSKRNKGANPGQGGYTVCRSKVVVLRMTILLTSVFAVLWLSYFVLFTIEEITDTDNSRHASSGAHTAKHVMMALSTITNPVLYAAFTKAFQNRLSGCCRKCKRVATEETVQSNVPQESLNVGKRAPHERVKETESGPQEWLNQREISPQEGNGARESCQQNDERKWENAHLEYGSEREGGRQEVENKMESGHQDGESEVESGRREGKSRWESGHQEWEGEVESSRQEGKNKSERDRRKGESRWESGRQEEKTESKSGHPEEKSVEKSGHQEGKTEKESDHQGEQSERETTSEHGESERENCRQKGEIGGDISRQEEQSRRESGREENCEKEWNGTKNAKRRGKYCEETDEGNEQYINGIWCPGRENHVFDPADEDVQIKVYKLRSRQEQSMSHDKGTQKTQGDEVID